MSDWFTRIPKVELHLHLEGAIPHAALWELINKYGGDPSVADVTALARKFEYRDFPHFLKLWDWKNQFLREYDDFTLIAELVARDLAEQNIRYAEVFYSPTDFAPHGLEVQALTMAIRAGLARVHGVEIMLVTDLVRDHGPARGLRTLAQVNEVRSCGVVGIGIGGMELDYPPEPYAPVYEQARRLGFHTSAHAGEGAGAASIWGALRSLHVERIGHGTRAEKDPALVDYLAAQQIPIEMCPLSNVRTGVVNSLAEHPVRRYFERGLVVTINSDDPKMFGNSLAEEYRLLHDQLGFNRAEIRQLILNGVHSSWLLTERKQELARAFCSDPTWNED